MGETASETLDVRGLACPLPVLKANRALRGLAPGARLTVLATDPAAPQDFAAFAAETGHALLESGADPDGAFRFVLQRREAP
jgi:tRNA 2-thiouridine synthesizing protein A